MIVAFVIIGYVFAVFIAVGGVFGYVKAESKPSLMAGILFGILLGAGAYFTSQDPPIALVQLLAAVLLMIVMCLRWYNTRKFMPAGIIFILSTVMAIANVALYYSYLPWP